MNKNEVIKELKSEYTQKLQDKKIALTELINENMSDANFAKLYTEYKQFQLKYYHAKYEKKDEKIAEKNYDTAKENFQKYLKTINKNIKDFELQYNCEKCKDTGFINNKMCKCFEKTLTEKLNKSLNNFSLSNNFENSKHSTLKIKDINKIYETIKKWCVSYPDTKICNINLLGQTGTGKTYLLECIANEMIEKGKIVQYVTAFNLNNECRKYHCNEKNVLNDYLDAEILLIDDLGTEPMLNNVTKEYLYNIINERIDKNLPTIISSNLLLADIEKRYGIRVYSRLVNKTTALNIMFEGTDTRTNL